MSTVRTPCLVHKYFDNDMCLLQCLLLHVCILASSLVYLPVSFPPTFQPSTPSLVTSYWMFLAECVQLFFLIHLVDCLFVSAKLCVIPDPPSHNYWGESEDERRQGLFLVSISPTGLPRIGSSQVKAEEAADLRCHIACAHCQLGVSKKNCLI